MNVKYAKSKGFIEINSLVALLVVCLMLPICLVSYRFLTFSNLDWQEVEDEIVLYKLRKIYLLSYDQNISDDELSFIYNNKTWSLSKVNDHLLLKPGSQIFLDDIDDLYFFFNDEVLYVHYTRKGQTYEKVIGQKERLYRSDFLELSSGESQSIGDELLED